MESKGRIEEFKKALKYPDWYIRLENQLKEDFFPVVHDDPILKARRHELYGTIEEMLILDQIPLAKEGPNFDKDRKPIDTIVIHHTEEDPDITLERLSAIGLVRQYALWYLKNDVFGHKLRGKPIWSGHFKDGKMVFFAYTWLVRANGRVEKLLLDKYVGRQSANQEINTRSVGIALSGNYEHSTPPHVQIEATANLIKTKYPKIVPSRILGHLEVKKDRTCPGDKFLGGWKNDLLSII
ncbi:MAG: hypothetical protein A2W22_04510 [Candidatus Levybacteria bacterium RBG_16_35_11]|nr:MAG: hypothetical protein A2W22_04510 [Candidatus Levybacteria bacterium RBG_16_35_11]